MIGLLVALSPRTAGSSRLSTGWLAGRSPPPHSHVHPRPGARPAAAPSCTRRTRATAARHAEQTARRSAEGEAAERARGSIGTSRGEGDGGGGCRDGAWRGVAWRTCSTSQSSSSCSSRRLLRGACRPTRTSTPRVYSQETVRGADSARGESVVCAPAGPRQTGHSGGTRRPRRRPRRRQPRLPPRRRPALTPGTGRCAVKRCFEGVGLGPAPPRPSHPKSRPAHISPGHRPRPSSAPASPACAPAAWRGAQRRTASQPRFETPSTVTRRARAW